MWSPAPTTRFSAAVKFLIAQNYGRAPGTSLALRERAARKAFGFMAALVANVTAPKASGKPDHSVMASGKLDQTVPVATGGGNSMPVASNEENIDEVVSITDYGSSLQPYSPYHSSCLINILTAEQQTYTFAGDWRDLSYPSFGPRHFAGKLSLLWPPNPESETFPEWSGALYILYGEIMELVWLGDWQTAAPPDHSNHQHPTLADAYLEWQEVLAVLNIAFALHRAMRVHRLLMGELDSLRSGKPQSGVNDCICRLKGKVGKILGRRQDVVRPTGNAYRLEYLAGLVRESPEGRLFVAGSNGLIGEIGRVSNMAGHVLSAVQRVREAIGILRGIQARRTALSSMASGSNALPSPPNDMDMAYSVHPGRISALLDGVVMVEAAVESFIVTTERQKMTVKRLRGLYPESLTNPVSPRRRSDPDSVKEDSQFLMAKWYFERWVEGICAELEGVGATYKPPPASVLADAS